MRVNGEDFFSRTPVDLEGATDAEADAALGALLHLYLRDSFDEHKGCWPGRDEHDTLRRTCHAVEVLHRLNLDADTATMVRAGGNWLINLPVYDILSQDDRDRLRLYPSRFKTLAYLKRFDDDLLRRDYADLLRKEVGGMVRGVTESDVLTTCIVLDTLVTLEENGQRYQVCSNERYGRIITALNQQLRGWKPPSAHASGATRARAQSVATSEASAATSGGRKRRPAPPCEIDNWRDLSYVLGLLLTADRTSIAPKQLEIVTNALSAQISERTRAHFSDLAQVHYTALQLAEHFRGEETIHSAISALLAELRATYATPDATRRWDFSYHATVMRLLLTHHGDSELARRVVARYLRDAERRHAVERGTVDVELRAVIRERIEIEVGHVMELSGGYTDDHIYRVPFVYGHPAPEQDGAWHPRQEASVVIKRSTSDAFHTATENYRKLPPAVRRYFVRQPQESQVHKSGLSSAYFLVMEDLVSLATFEQLFNDFDQRAMADHHMRLLRPASDLICDAVCALFQEARLGRADFPGPQVARLYLAPMESKLSRAIARVTWLKNPLDGYTVAEQKYKGLEHYLTTITRHMQALQPVALGLTHGDLHPRNVMLDRNCTQLKLIDLDKLSWTGDYLADLGSLLADLCVFRRVAAPDREFGLARERIRFTDRPEAIGAENVVEYPALGRPATVVFQQHTLARLARFADELEDRAWQARLWLATAAGLIVRLAFTAQKESAAVLYGEAVRLLAELTRHLEQSQPLPPLLFPEQRPQATSRTEGETELPEWVTGSQALAALHDGLLQLRLRPRADRNGVTYTKSAGGERPQLRLVPPRREGIARLLLPSGALDDVPDARIKIVRSGQEGDAFGTILIFTESSEVGEALRLVRHSLAAAVRD
ncbi:MAG: hypothetical protein OJF49_002899 [Ktedonobacterales bacterium]|nr:MAG: hypothetical protein OJF49_002899 [Ktedonobacterales bacterium]